MIGVKQFSAKLSCEILIRKVGAVSLLMVRPSAGFNSVGFWVVLALREGIPIPFGVSEFAGDDRRIGWHGIGAPMNENSELGLRKPGGCRPLVERIPGGLIGLCL